MICKAFTFFSINKVILQYFQLEKKSDRDEIEKSAL